jgi:hypothetical protein
LVIDEKFAATSHRSNVQNEVQRQVHVAKYIL